MFYVLRQPFLAADAGGGTGVVSEAQPTAQEKPATETETQVEDQVSAQADAKAKETAQTASEADAQKAAAAQPPAADMNRIVNAELRVAAALAGVSKDNLGYVLKLADTAGADKEGADIPALCDAAVAKVIQDLPALAGSGGVGTGASGEHKRTATPDYAKMSDADYYNATYLPKK